MDTRSLIELATLIGGIVTAIAGIVNAIRGRRADDAALSESAGQARVDQAKTAEDITAPGRSYQAQVEAHMADLQTKLAQANAVIKAAGIAPQKTNPPPTAGGSGGKGPG